MHRVLITGGAGFIGSHLCRRLLDDGAHVVCVDNLLTGRLENLDDLAGHEGFSFVRHDESQSPVVFADLPKDDPKVRRPDITRARENLDWEPLVEPEDGLMRAAAYFEAEVRRADG